MKEKVLHIVGSMNSGGTETMLLNIYKSIDRKKVQFDFLCFSNQKSYYQDEIENLGGKIINISNPKSIKQISKVIEENGTYKVVHAHTLFNSGFALIAAKKNNIKIRISHAHTTSDDESNLIRKIYIKLMRKILKKYSTKFLACSKSAGEYLFGSEILKSDKYEYFQNLIDYKSVMIDKTEQVKKFKKVNSLDTGIVIGHIGTFKETKNQRFLVEILKDLKNKNIDAKLLLVGDGSMRNEIEAQVNEYNLEKEVVFTGVRKDINTMLQCMNVFVLPSIFEGLGLVLLEAQAAGLPCVVSEAIQPEADLELGLFNKLNLSDGVEAWADKIIEVAGKKETDKQKILKAFDEHGYSSQKCISKLLSIYEMDK